MENTIILHSTPLKDLIELFGQTVEDKLKLFTPVPPPSQVTGEYLTRRETCTRLRISLATLHNLTKDGTLNGYRIGGRVLYRLAEVETAVQRIQASKYKHGRA